MQKSLRNNLIFNLTKKTGHIYNIIVVTTSRKKKVQLTTGVKQPQKQIFAIISATFMEYIKWNVCV